MKSTRLLTIAISVLTFLGSCSATHVFTSESFFEGYVETLNSKNKNDLLDKIYILLTQQELVHADYELISWNVFVADNKEILKTQFFAKAAEKADEEGGNAVLINSPGCYSVLKVKNWNGHEPEKLYENPIFNNKTINELIAFNPKKFKTSKYSALKYSCVMEIEGNIRCARNQEELDFIRKKIETLSKFDENNPKADLSISTRKLTKELQKKEKKLNQ